MRIRTARHLFAGTFLIGSALGASAVVLTFQVNMKVQTELGIFHPETDTMEVRGSFNAPGGGAWLPGPILTNSPTDTNVYSGAWDVVALNGNPATAGANVAHKFLFYPTAGGSQSWEGAVGPNGANNRAVALPAADAILPVEF